MLPNRKISARKRELIVSDVFLILNTKIRMIATIFQIRRGRPRIFLLCPISRNFVGFLRAMFEFWIEADAVLKFV